VKKPVSKFAFRIQPSALHRGFKVNKGISVLLTTHFMDEADILSDRVAIMSKAGLC
jgi:ABC-type multidrug transport system ATPase subunit